ncbi:hypothetical protein K439DRAFT_1619219 [Ramaria rubella]|nr:hypothetical protein K439DRAFT_1619219 [Ramaria rubella]
MVLTALQQQAVQDAQQLLLDSGLEIPLNQSPDKFLNSLRAIPMVFPNPLDNLISIPNLQYEAPKAIFLTKEQNMPQEFKLTRKSAVHAIIDHPVESIVEYPETGSLHGVAIAHIFAISPSQYIHPKDNLQYSLRDSKGGHKNVGCYLLKSRLCPGKLVPCYQTKVSCRSVKGCMFVGAESKPGCDLNQTIQPRTAGFSPDAHHEVFLKTLSIFVTVASKRCHAVESAIKDEYADIHEDSSIIDELSPPFDIHAQLDPVCDGSIHLCMGSYGKPYIRCEHWRKGHKGHLLITKLDEYDIKYLTALFENDTCYILMVELDAKVAGYGPLHSCGYVAARREQKQLCHRFTRFGLAVLM